jgi:hypothetical protein
MAVSLAASTESRLSVKLVSMATTASSDCPVLPLQASSVSNAVARTVDGSSYRGSSRSHSSKAELFTVCKDGIHDFIALAINGLIY